MALDDVPWSKKFEVVVSLLLVSIYSALSCPLDCECGVEDDDLKYVDCHGVNLTSIPVGIPPATTALLFTKTHITRFPEDAFQRLPNLKIINMYANPLTSIDVNAFRGLTRLEKLYIVNGKLRTLPDELFKDTIGLEHVSFNRNKITSISDTLLSGLTSLRFLFLSNNRISFIGDRAFTSVAPTLKHLNLDSNHLSEFPVRSLQGFTQLVDLRLVANNFTTVPIEALSIFDKMAERRPHSGIWLSQNPLVCTKELIWLQTWMTTHPKVVQDEDSITCRGLDGNLHNVIHYNFSLLDHWSIGPLKNWTEATPATSSSTSSPTSMHTSFPTSNHKSASTSNTTTFPQTNLSTRKALTTISTKNLTVESKNNQSTTSTTQLSSTWNRNHTTKVEIPTSNLLTFTAASNTFVSTTSLKKDSETKKSALTRNQEVILAASLTGAFMIVVVALMLYCFRRKLLRRQKTPLGYPAFYDRIGVVV